MTINEFTALRDLPEKTVLTDLIFSQTINPDIFTSEIRVNALGAEIVLNATYYDARPSIVFNFRVIGNDAICRYCVNHTEHKDAITKVKVRTHKHTPKNDNCFNGSNNLPYAYTRTDLQITDFSDVAGIWAIICREANIKHLGKVAKL